MRRSNKSRRGQKNKKKCEGSAAEAVAAENAHCVEESSGNPAPRSSSLTTNVIVTPTAGLLEVPPTPSELCENVDNSDESNENKLLDPDCSTDSAEKFIGGAPATVQSAGVANNAPVCALADAAHPASSPLEEVDMNVDRVQQEEQDVSISLMAVSATDSSSTEYESVDDEDKENINDDSEAESALLLPDTPRNSSNDGPAAVASTDSSVSDSSSDFTFDLAYGPGEKKLCSAPPSAAAAASSKVVVRPPAIFVNNISDFNPTFAKRPRLDLSCLESLEDASTNDTAPAAAGKEESKPSPVPRVSEEALASLSVTHIASDLLNYYVRTRAPAFVQRFVAPKRAEKTTAPTSDKISSSFATEVFGFGSPIDKIDRIPAPWEEPFGSPLEDAPRPPAPWEGEEEEEEEEKQHEKEIIDSSLLPDEEETSQEESADEDWEEMKHREWHEDVPPLEDPIAMRNAWLLYCEERSNKIAAMLESEDHFAATEAKFEADKVLFKELETSVVSNKRKLADVSSSKLCYFNLMHTDFGYKNLPTETFLNDLVSVTSPMKHKFLENDYSEQVRRRMTASKPGFGTGLGIALEYPSSENSQRDMRLAEAAASQAVYYFSNGNRQYVRPPVQRSRDEIENLPAVKYNPARYLQSGVIVTRECDGQYFQCTVDRPPMDLRSALAVRARRRRGTTLRKHLASDVWKVPPPPCDPSYSACYYRSLDKVKQWKYAMECRLEFALIGYNFPWRRQHQQWQYDGGYQDPLSFPYKIVFYLLEFMYKVYKSFK